MTEPDTPRQVGTPSRGLPEGMRLRPARPTDLDQVAQLDRELFGVEAWSRASHREELAHPWRRYFVVVGHSGELIGWAGVLLGDVAEVLTIGVSAAHQRRGIGAVLLQQLLDVARASGAQEIFLEVRTDDAGAIRLYERAGFAGIAVRPRYYEAAGKDALVMRATLG